MTHTICTADRSEELAYIQRLWSSLLVPGLDLGTKLERLFASETEEFDLDYAYLSRIDLDDETKRFEVVHDPDDHLDTAEPVPLDCTFCRETVEAPGGTMAISDTVAAGWLEDPAYKRFGFRSYVGTIVTVDGELYGTLCFADTDPRDEPFADEEVTLVEMIGQWATYELNQWTGPPTHRTVSRNLGEPDRLRSSQVNAVMDALAKRPRRVVLLSLLDDDAEVTRATVQRATGADVTAIELQHTHFPKLDRAGYVEWNREENSVSRGENYAEIEPFLRLLKAYTTECST